MTDTEVILQRIAVVETLLKTYIAKSEKNEKELNALSKEVWKTAGVISFISVVISKLFI